MCARRVACHELDVDASSCTSHMRRRGVRDGGHRPDGRRCERHHDAAGPQSVHVADTASVSRGVYAYVVVEYCCHDGVSDATMPALPFFGSMPAFWRGGVSGPVRCSAGRDCAGAHVAEHCRLCVFPVNYSLRCTWRAACCPFCRAASVTWRAQATRSDLGRGSCLLTCCR